MQAWLRHFMENYRGKRSIGVAVSLALKEEHREGERCSRRVYSTGMVLETDYLIHSHLSPILRFLAGAEIAPLTLLKKLYLTVLLKQAFSP